MTSQALTREASAPSSVVNRLLSTDASLAPVAARLTLAAVLFPHGAQKLLGWFGGYGYEGTMGFLTGQVGLPYVAALGVVLPEFFGPFLLALGLGTRLVGAGFVALMAGAVATVHAQFGFFMNWSGQAAGEGFEYHLLVIGLGLVVALAGAGRWSLDRKLTDR